MTSLVFAYWATTHVIFIIRCIKKIVDHILDTNIVIKFIFEHTGLTNFIAQMQVTTFIFNLSRGKWEVVVVSWCTLAETVINATGFI